MYQALVRPVPGSGAALWWLHMELQPQAKDGGAGPQGAVPAGSPCSPPGPLTSLRYSAWCFVATNTTVWSWGRTTLRSRWSSTAALVSSRTMKKEVCGERGALWVGAGGSGQGNGEGPERGLTLSCSLSLVSTSSRMSTGSVRPAVGTEEGGGESLTGRTPSPGPDSQPPAHSPARANSTSILGSVAENRTV